jgi:hypothetical protein
LGLPDHWRGFGIPAPPRFHLSVSFQEGSQLATHDNAGFIREHVLLRLDIEGNIVVGAFQNPLILKGYLSIEGDDTDTFTLNTAEHHCSTMQR